MKKIMLLASVALLMASQSKALEVQPYVGADYVYSWADIKNSKYFEDRYQALHFSVGAMTSSVMGLELSYQQSEQKKKSSSFGQTKAEYKAYGLDGVYYLGLMENVQGIGAVGLGYYEVKAKIKSGGDFHRGDDEHFGLRAGAGVQYSIDANWAVRVMGRYHYVNADALNHMFDVTAGVRYYF